MADIASGEERGGGGWVGSSLADVAHVSDFLGQAGQLVVLQVERREGVERSNLGVERRQLVPRKVQVLDDRHLADAVIQRRHLVAWHLQRLPTHSHARM